jgi:hypothetical protein
MALFVGLSCMLAVSPRRLATLGATLVLLPGPLLAIIASSRALGLTRAEKTFALAESDGHRLAWVLVVCCLVAAASAFVLARIEHRISLGSTPRRVLGAAIAVVVSLVVIVAVVQYGGPSTMWHRAVSSFEVRPSQLVSPDLNQRLFRFGGSGRTDIWRVALNTYESHRTLGVGAGSFERYWQQNPKWTQKAKDAHSLYLEVLAELGPVGLILMLGALSIPLGACIAMRRTAVIPGAAGAYVAYLVHAGIDWDWELSGITFAALLTGSLGLVAYRTGRHRHLSVTVRAAAGLAVVAGAAFMLGGYLGNDALARAQAALDAGNPQVAVSESRVGSRWAPWSPYPLTVRGEALLRLNRVDAARAAFGQAIDRDSGYWRAWLGLAVASEGSEREAAMSRAKALYPRSVEIEQTEQLLADVDGRPARG